MIPVGEINLDLLAALKWLAANWRDVAWLLLVGFGLFAGYRITVELIRARAGK